MTTDELKDYYKDLLIIQYQNAPKALATVGAFVGEVIADQIFTDVRDAFDIETAIGEQLDIIGEYFGIDRFVYGISLAKAFFAMPSVTDPGTYSYKGFASAGMTDPQVTWYFLRVQDINSIAYKMNDVEYRTVLKFAALAQSSFLSIEDIDEILLEFFGNFATLTDNGNMTITYNDPTSDPNINIFNLIRQSDALPKPAGVSISVTHI